MDEYIIVEWPESQELMEQEWFDECVLINDETMLDKVGNSAYFVPKHLYQILCNESNIER